ARRVYRPRSADRPEEPHRSPAGRAGQGTTARSTGPEPPCTGNRGDRVIMNAEKRREIFRRFHEDNPEPKTELAYSTPFELLIAVILSAQATDVGVNKATAKLYPVANTPEAIYALGVEGLSEYIKTIGLYRGKAKNVIE